MVARSVVVFWRPITRALGALVSAQLLVISVTTHAAETPAAAAQRVQASAASVWPHASFGGQYRINAYTADNDEAKGRQTAARLRIRQNLDFQLVEEFTTHLQMELGHTKANKTTTAGSGIHLALRHAVLQYHFENGIGLQAGIVPVADDVGDVLFSSDWDYNPLALSLEVPLGGGKLRAFAGILSEGVETLAKDDFVHYQLDYTRPFEGGHGIGLQGSVVTVQGVDGRDRVHANYGVFGRLQATSWLEMRGFVLGSHTDRHLLGTKGDADGVAVKLELRLRCGASLLATYATGGSDGSGFLPVMALAKTNGYWGYTGLLTIQGPTDTGFDGDSLNIANNGYGLVSAQLRFAREVWRSTDIQLAAGWFGASNTPKGRDEFVGADGLVMGTYHLNRYLALDAGAAYAQLGDSVSGYDQGVVGGAPFNQPKGDRRNKYVFFARLQAEF